MKVVLEFTADEERQIEALRAEYNREYPTLADITTVEHLLRTAVMKGVRDRTECLRRLHGLKDAA